MRMREPPGLSLPASLRRVGLQPFARLPVFLGELRDRFGPIASFAVPMQRFVLVNDPPAIKEVLVTKQQAFHKSRGIEALRRLLGDGLLTSEDPLHREMRRIVQPAFHKERIAAYATAMRAAAEELARRLHDGETVDLHALMVEVTLRIASITLFGSDAGGTASRVSAALEQLMHVFPAAFGPFRRLREHLPLPSMRRFDRARRTLDEIVYALIAERRGEAGSRGDALSLLLAAQHEAGIVDDKQLRDEAITLFLAGHETTANLLTWAWILLADHPEVERLLYQQVDGLADGFDRDAIARDAPLVQRVILETLRLFPPAWLIGRRAIADVTIGGYTLRKGTAVMICPWVLHRTGALYPQPESFDPDRWLRDAPPPFAFVPFGGGARRCIGEEFALHEAAIVLATLARCLRFVRAWERPVRPRFLVTLRPNGPVPVRVVTRTGTATRVRTRD